MGRVSDFPQLTDDLYHYTSAEVGVDSVLSQMRFRMGLIECTNDPREPPLPDDLRSSRI
jgi:hypothetical protein